MRIEFAQLLTIEARGDDRFIVKSEGSGFLFGGLSMAVALRAAGETVNEHDKVPLSLHASFLAGGDWGGPHEVAIQRTFDSRAFAHRRIELTNSGRVALVADAVFHKPEPGDDRFDAGQIRLAAPELLTGAPLPTPADVAEIRPPPAPHQLVEPEHPYWCKLHTLATDPVSQACGLAFVSDYWVIATPFLHGERAGERLTSRTLEHTLWLHRPVTQDDWWYVDCAPISLAGGRYVSRGSLQQRDGLLLASFVQLGFVRPKPI